MFSEKVSVIIPTYNYANFIKEAIDSIFQQTYPSELIEVIIVDDGSVDETAKVLEPYLSHNVKYFYQENKGKANATKRAIEKCSGKYIFNLDADDYFYKDKISRSVEIFEKHPLLVHVASPADFYDTKSKISVSEQLPADLVGKYLNGMWLIKRFYNSNILFGGGTTFAARSSVLKSIVIPDRVDMYIDEFLILAILPFGGSFFFEDPLSVWRVHGANYSGNGLVDEKFINKSRRLLSSSEAVLSYLQENDFDKEIIKIYKLQDATRRISFMESTNQKKARHIFHYAKEVFIDIGPNWNLVKNYNVINRLIPSSLFNILKKMNTH